MAMQGIITQRQTPFSNQIGLPSVTITGPSTLSKPFDDVKIFSPLLREPFIFLILVTVLGEAETIRAISRPPLPDWHCFLLNNLIQYLLNIFW